MLVRNQDDGDLQMFVEDRRAADVQYPRFLRWLAEHGGLEHRVAGPPSGELLLLSARRGSVIADALPRDVSASGSHPQPDWPGGFSHTGGGCEPD
jgi:hypothetical protein